MKINYDSIVRDSEPRLRESSEKVTLPLSKKDTTILMDMIQYLRDSIVPELAQSQNLRPGVGIAAPQIGIMKQMLAVSIDYGEDGKDEYALVNPRIVSHSVQHAYLKNGEGCLSVEKEHEGYVYRHARITIKGYDALQQKEVKIKLSDYEAIVLQHEMDHLHGILFYDRINQDDPWIEDAGAIVID